MTQLRIGILGCGRIALSTHLPILAAMDDVRLVALAEPDAILRERALTIAPGAMATADWREVVARDDVDAIVICLPTAMHADAATAALGGGKHIYLEKPIACNLAEGERVLDIWRKSGRVGMVGFNYRFNPLAVQLKQLIQAGRIGQPLSLQSIFCTRAGDLPGWKANRGTGGGVLLDLASHHIDLFRFLLGSEMQSVFAKVSSLKSEADTATLTLSDTNGTSISSFFSLRSLEKNHIEIFGTEGKLSLDFYGSTKVHYVAAARNTNPAEQLTESAAEIWRRGKRLVSSKIDPRVSQASWRAALAEFVSAVREKRPPCCNLQDGMASLTVIDAAERSAAAKAVVEFLPETVVNGQPATPSIGVRDTLGVCFDRISPSPGTPGEGWGGGRLAQQRPNGEPHSAPPPAPTLPSPGVPGEGKANPPIVSRPSVAVQTADTDVNAPALSVILATPGPARSISATLRALRAQTICSRLELVLVVESRERFGVDDVPLEGFHSVQIVEVGEIRSVAHADTQGVRAASAPIVVFAEDHAFPEPGWAAALLEAHLGPWAAVGPLIKNANPDTAISCADLLLGYGPWIDPAQCGERSHLPGHNSSYKRQALLDYGARLEEMLAAETLIQWDMASKGLRLYQAADAHTRHTNFSLLAPFADASFSNGRAFGAARAMQWSVGRRLLFFFASPLIPLVRFVKIVRGAKGSAPHRATLQRGLWALALGLLLDGIGQMLGYAFGPGNSAERLKKVEFNREANITAKDRAMVFATADESLAVEAS